MLRRVCSAVIMACVFLAAGAAACADEGSDFSKGLETLSILPVQSDGRIKPLSVYAAEKMARAPLVETAAAGATGGRDALFFFIRQSAASASQRGATLFDARLYPAPVSWLSAAAVLHMESATADETAFASLVGEVVRAAASDDADAFNGAASSLASLLAPRYGAEDVDLTRVKAEAVVERLRPLVVCAFLYLVAELAAFVLVARGAPRRLTALVVGIAFAVNLATVVLYGWVAGRIPVNNSYEGLLVLSVALGLFAVLSCLSPRLYAGAAMGPILAAAFLFVAEFTPIRRGIAPPVPALKSLWLQVHVLTCFVAYAAFALGFAASTAVLASRAEERRGRFDYLAYRATLLGFVFLSAGILTGAAWAKQAWGRYWGFDPKETWALVTWLVYAGYLHLGLLKGRRDTLRALAAVAGFMTVIFTFFGVNYLLSGLHSYG